MLAHAWSLRGLRIQEVAERAGVSSHAVNRFARRLGYAGYRDFSHALAMELGRIQGAAYALPETLTERLDASGSPDDALTVASRVFALELAALRDTWQALDRQVFRRAIETFGRAERILFVSTGAGIGVSQTAVYRLTVLGLSASAASDAATTIAQMHLLQPGDVVVGLSFHGTSRPVVEGLEYARERGLTTICITAVPDSPAGRLADIQIAVCGDEAQRFGQFASRVATATLLEALASAVAWERRESALPHAHAVAQASQGRNGVSNHRNRSRSA